jgi:hypothetical protein
VQLLRKHSEVLDFSGDIVCFVCSAEFSRLADLFQHLASKCRDVNEMVAVAHHSLFDAIVLPFVGKDPDT